jgi:hypothetical protein
MTRRCAICDEPLLPTNTTGICAECILTARNGDLHCEAWLPVVGFQGWEISDRGRIRDARTHQIREPDTSGRYPRIHLNGRRRNVHQLMATSWLGPMPWGAGLVRHLDDDPDHFGVTNLAWGTHADNAEDAKRNRASVGNGPTRKEEHR